MSQKIENVHPEIAGEKIHIFYDLTGIASGQSVVVKAYMSTDGGRTYGESLKSVTGDVGVVVGPGKNRCIVWNVFEEVEELVSVNVKFKVRADLIPSDSYGSQQPRFFKLDFNTNLGSKGILNSRSYGLNLKGAVFFNQLGTGIKGGYYRTFREKINYSDALTTYPDTGYYWGYYGGAFIEYDLIRNTRYSLYPYLCVGQTKILYKYNQDYKQDEYFRYSVFGTLGMGFDYNIYRFLYLGAELEYCLTPWFDLVPSGNPDEGLDGFSLGIIIRFVINAGPDG